MIAIPSPLENLAAFSICFALGALSAIGLTRYVAYVRAHSVFIPSAV